MLLITYIVYANHLRGFIDFCIKQFAVAGKSRLSQTPRYPDGWRRI